MTPTLIVPGLNSSGSAHWQSWFESELPDAVRVVQRDWKTADLPEWSSRVRRAIVGQASPVLIAAHSFGALAAVQAADDLSDHVAGLLLVAPADPDKFGLADMLPASRLDVPTIVVASTNDRWLAFPRAVELAVRWGAALVDLGPAGHINAESGYGRWPEGIALLRRLERESALTKSAYDSRRAANPSSAAPPAFRQAAERIAEAGSATARERRAIPKSVMADSVSV